MKRLFPIFLYNWLEIKRNHWIILMIGLFLRMLYALYFGEMLWEGDAGDYVRIAGDITLGKSFDTYWPPGLPYYLAFWFGVFGKTIWVSVIAMLGCYIGLHLLLEKSLRNFLSTHWSNAFLLAMVLYPNLIHHSVAPLTQLPVAVLLLGIVGMFLKWENESKIQKILIVGLVLSIAILFRAGTITLLPILLFWGISKFRWRFQQSVIFLCACALPVIFWQIQLYPITGTSVFINEANAYNLYLGNNPWAPDYKNWWLGSHDVRSDPFYDAFYQERDSIFSLEHQYAPAFQERAISYIFAHPWHFLQRVFHRTKVFFSLDSLTGAFSNRKSTLAMLAISTIDAIIYSLLSILAICGIFRTQERGVRNFLLLFIFFYFVPYGIAFSHPTYRLALVPLWGFLIHRSSWMEWEALSKLYKLGTWLLIIIFSLIQMEWVFRMIL